MKNQLVEQEFITLIQRYQQVIWKVCYIYAKDSNHLNDLYQETLINLWRAFPHFRQESKVSTWIYKIALNSCISYFRRFSQSPKAIPITRHWDCIMEDDQFTEQLQELYRLINQLNPLEKALILLWLEEKNYNEIAEITGLTPTNVATKLNRIKEKMKKMSKS